MNTATPKARQIWVIRLILVLGTLAIFGQVLNHDFINYDDPDYVTHNPHVQAGLTLEGLIWAFRTDHACNWHPLTWLSHMLDCQLYDLHPGGSIISPACSFISPMFSCCSACCAG